MAEKQSLMQTRRENGLDAKKLAEAARRHFKEIEELYFKAEPVTAFKSPPFREDTKEWMQKILVQHGVTIADYGSFLVLTFPEGTTKKEILPRLSSTYMRYRVVLSDGYELRETTYRQTRGYSYLAFLNPEEITR